jgi:predicted permease
VFRTEHLNRELQEEQEFHIGCRTADLIEGGMSPDEASSRARVEFGNRVRAREESRDAKLFGWLESTGRDLYYGFRTLRKSPSFAAVAILTLALGIGANTAIFSVVNGVLLNPLPYHEPNRIICLFEKFPDSKFTSISYPNFVDWQRMNRTFSAMAAYRGMGFTISGEGEPEHVEGEMVSAGFFEIFGVSPLIGRTFNKDDDHLGAASTVMISEALWKRKFGSTRDIIGRRLIVDGIGRTIIGVVPFKFRFQYYGRSRTDIYNPIGEWREPQFYANRIAGWGLAAVGHLKPGVTLAQARSDMDRVARQLAMTYPDVDSNVTTNLIPIKEVLVGDVRPVLLILLAAVGFVLLIACVNVANLLLARSTARQREFAIRASVGAGQMRIVRQLLTESTLLALIGGALGLLIAKFGTAAAITAMPQSMPRAEEIGLDLRVLLFTALVSIAAGIVFGVAPALRMRHVEIAGDLKESARTVAKSRNRAQSVFVVVEMAMALVLLIGAGLMIRTLFVLWGADPGFDPHNVMTFSVSSPSSLLKEKPSAIRAFFRQMHDELASAPGVQTASLSYGAELMNGDDELYFWFPGRPRPAHVADLPMALAYIVEPEYLKTLHIALLRGRFLSDSDVEHAPAVVVIDQTLAEKYFPAQNPIGQYLELGTDPSDPGRMPNPRIVGVVAHVNQWGLDLDTATALRTQMYISMAQIPDSSLKDLIGVSVHARGKRGVPDFATLRQQLLTLNGDLVAFNAYPMEQIVLRSIASKRFSMTLLAVFAGLALLLASIGIYGVLSYLVGQRTQEIGVRMALGAERLQVLRMVLADGARMALAGIAIGVVAAVGLTRLMSGMLFGVKPTDAMTFTLVSLTVCAIALLACYVPARRAMKIDPITALRNE